MMAGPLRSTVFTSVALCLLPGLLPPTAYAKHVVLQAPVEDRGELLKFGQATCVSQNGRRVAIGANAFQKYKGAIYVYDLASEPGDRMEHWRRTRLCGNDTKPAEEKKPRELRVVERGSGFGFSCAASAASDQIIVGAPGHNMQKGAVYIFSKTAASHEWQESGKLSFPGGRNGDSFGWEVAVSDQCTYIAVSAKGRRANNGEVYMFKCLEGCRDCELVCRLEPPDYTDSAGPRGIRIRNNFGISMAMNGDAEYVAVGCTGFQEERGAVYIYTKEENGSSWKYKQRLESPNSQKFGFFGFKLSIDRSGRQLAVGADGEDKYRGAVYTFQRTGTSADRHTFQLYQELMSEKRAAEDNFGGSVALSGDGKALIVGAPGANKGNMKDKGAVYMYEDIGGLTKTKWGLSERLWLSAEHSRFGDFFAWTVGISGDGKRYVATAPDSYGGTGLATVGIFAITGRRTADGSSLAHDDVFETAKDEL